MSPSALVLCGLGAVSAAGAGREAAAAALASGLARAARVPRGSGYHLPRGAQTAAQVADCRPDLWLPAAARRMSPPSRYAVAAARMAAAEARLPAEEAGGPTAVALATNFGACEFSEGLVRQILLSGPQAASPFFFTESVANAPAAQVALALGARGANLTIAQREAGPLLALAAGAREVTSGRAARALVGAVDEVTPLLHALLDRFHALARPRGSEAEAARPFDRRRNGFLLGEGAAIAVLEREESARRRGAPILARLRPLPGAFDPDAPATGWSRDPERLARALAGRLAAAAVPPRSIDVVVASAAGSRAGDRLEALLLRRVFAGGPLPPLLAPKAVLGEFGGAGLLAAVLALAGAPFGPTPGFTDPDPELGVEPHRGAALPPPRRVLLGGLAVGGAAAWALLEREEVA